MVCPQHRHNGWLLEHKITQFHHSTANRLKCNVSVVVIALLLTGGVVHPTPVRCFWVLCCVVVTTRYLLLQKLNVRKVHWKQLMCKMYTSRAIIARAHHTDGGAPRECGDNALATTTAHDHGHHGSERAEESYVMKVNLHRCIRGAARCGVGSVFIRKKWWTPRRCSAAHARAEDVVCNAAKKMQI